ncbi:DUF6342 family protein [Kitasatospora sp. NPDC001547]|uniref:DUF6342 family protein n=1 Tax=Kitasatospora sp. NPDC001547 TaxID=3364015 RepID=UPI0036B9D280|nr:hypothetical protein KitaXyl93_56340 [Kitasatospora sp. Xyl93]
MPDIDLGVASDWQDGDFNGRVKLRQNPVLQSAAKKDVVVSGPLSIELSVNTNFSTSQEADKIYFTTHRGGVKKIIAVLDSDGVLSIAGQVFTNQKNLTY